LPQATRLTLYEGFPLRGYSRTLQTEKAPDGFFRLRALKHQDDASWCLSKILLKQDQDAHYGFVSQNHFYGGIHMLNVSRFKTLTGLTIAEVAVRLDAELPKEAYSAVPGAANLTDIDPNWMRKVFNEIFGICGIGWGYKYDPVDLHISTDIRARSSGGSRTVHVAALTRLTFWYKVTDEPGAVVTCEIDASGGSENDVEAYAMKGAITSALGNAASNLGFQESVYLGKRSHQTVGKKTASPAASKPAPAKSAAAAQNKTNVPSDAAPKPVLKPAPVPPSVPAAADVSTFVVTIGARAGRTLGDIFKSEGGGKAIQFYTTMATGGNPAKEALKNAAVAFLAKNNGHVPQSVAA